MQRLLLLFGLSLFAVACVQDAPEASGPNSPFDAGVAADAANGGTMDFGAVADAGDADDDMSTENDASEPDMTTPPEGSLVVEPLMLEVELPVQVNVGYRAPGMEVTPLGSQDFEVSVQSGELRYDSGSNELTASAPGTGTILVSHMGLELAVDVTAELVLDDIEVGYDFACVVTARGRVWCWGDNSNGELGRMISNGSVDPVPTPIDHTNFRAPIDQVSCGLYHCSAIDRDGRLYGWGMSADDRLGVDRAGVSIFTPIEIPTGADRFSKVSAGESHGCALTRGGNVSCWGNNSSGQLGRSKESGTNLYQNVYGGASDVSAGGEGTCLIRASDDRVLCTGSTEFVPRPVAAEDGDVEAFREIGAATQVFADAIGVGRTHGCAIGAGNLTCWGSANGLGDAASSDPSGPTAVADLPENITELRVARSLNAFMTADGWHTVGAACDGDQATGSLGSPDVSTPIAFGPTAVKALARGNCHTCLVSADDAIHCAGAQSPVMGPSNVESITPRLIKFGWAP